MSVPPVNPLPWLKDWSITFFTQKKIIFFSFITLSAQVCMYKIYTQTMSIHSFDTSLPTPSQILAIVSCETSTAAFINKHNLVDDIIKLFSRPHSTTTNRYNIYGNIHRYTPITLYPTVSLYNNIIIIFDTVLRQKRICKCER